MATDYATLVTSRYTVAGAYIGQLIIPAPAITPDTRIPAYVAVGSRFAVASNQPVRRSFVLDQTVTFASVPPYSAPLPYNASNDKSVARMVKADGTEVKLNQWQFVRNTDTNKYDSVLINSEVFDPVTTYKISYQSVDRTVLDPFPVEDIREFVTVGNSPDAPDYNEFEHFFAPYTITQPVAATTNSNKTSVIGDPVAVGVTAGTGSIASDAASAFNHNYNRYYTVRCRSSGTLTGPVKTATFEWTAQPTSAGNDNLPPVPLNPGAPKPTFTITEVSAGSPATFTVELELGVKLLLAFGGSNFTTGDTWELNGSGPALVEIDERHANTNQFHESGSITKLDGDGFGTVAYASTNDPSNVFNAKYRIQSVAATDSSVQATVDVTRSGDGILWTAKVGGVGGNSLTVGLVDPGVPNSPLSVSVSGVATVVSLATDNAGSLISTLQEVIDAVAASTDAPIAGELSASDAVATPVCTGTADVTNGSTAVSAGIGTAFDTELHVGSRIKFSSDLSNVYVVASRTSSTITLTSEYLGDTTAAVPLTGTLAAVNNSISIVGTSTLFTTELTVGSRLKFDVADAEHVYIVASIADDTHLTLNVPFGETSAPTAIASIPGADVIEVSALVGKTTLGVTGTYTGTLAWSEYGERVGVSGTFPYTFIQASSDDPDMSLSNGVVVTLGLSNGPFVVGDEFDFTVKAPRQYYQAKDNRAVTLTTDAATNPGAGRGAVAGSFTTNTAEGGFGTFTAEDNAIVPSNAAWKSGRFAMAGNIQVAVRNMHDGPTTTAGGNRHVAANKFTFSATVNGVIDWSLISRTSETVAVTSILTDVLGTITGAAATPYMILANVPDEILSVVEAESGDAVSYSLITTSLGDNTQYVTFVTKPTVAIQVTYLFRGAEPAPGQVYYVTTKHVRPDELYNTPILIRSLDDGRRLLAPSETTNHLFIMNEIAMGDIAAPAIYVIQVKDADGDGIYTDVDFSDAITASEAPKAISDLVVLSHFSTLSQQLNSINKMADPFKRRFRMTWVGAPIGTPIGSEEEPNSLIALSRRTLQVFGSNPAHGTRVLVGATSATRDIKLQNNVVTEVTLDGSFVAGALAALVASFTDPADTVLRKTLPGFKEVQTYGDAESPNNLAIGASNIVFFTDQGGGVFRIEEDVTVDTFAPDFNLINNMTQKMFVVKAVRNELDSKLIGLIVPSAQAGVGLIRGFMVQMLSSLLGRGLIGRYQKADGSERPIDPNKDVIVFRDSADPTLYHLLFAFYLRNEIKRIFGLYVVNTNDFGA